MSKEEVPPWLREQLTRFEQVQQGLQATLAQKQQVEIELNEIESATSELKKSSQTDPVYKAAGSLLVKTSKGNMLKELEERKEVASTRSLVLGKQEVRMKEQAKDLQSKIEQALKTKGSVRPSES